MVLFININLNQRVEVDVYGETITGTIKYKGPLNGIAGDWVGVALDKARGRHDGMLNGRRYFFSRPNHGVFITADKIRFISIKRNKFDGYRPVSRRSEVDEELFTSHSSMVIEQDRDPRDHMGWVSEDYLNRATKVFPESGRDLDVPTRYHLSHSISNNVPACTMLRPTATRARFFYGDEPCAQRYHREQDWELAEHSFNHWISSPSIPKTHMPKTVLERQVECGWDDSHYVREMSVHTGRDSMKFNQWNDISE